MYPELFSIGDFTVSTFGVMLAAGFYVGTLITARRMGEEGLDPEKAFTLLIYVMLGGILGSKLYYAVDVSLREGTAFLPHFFARDGITWYGGLILATLVGAVGCRIHGVPIRTFANCTVVGGAVGQALGRVGCFLVGDDYGRITDLPWGIAFPRGAPPTLDPVHPTSSTRSPGCCWWRRCCGNGGAGARFYSASTSSSTDSGACSSRYGG